jgi:hypothetical protein
VRNKPVPEGAYLRPDGEIVERVTFTPEDASISSILRALLEQVDINDVFHVLQGIRGESVRHGDLPGAML